MKKILFFILIPYLTYSQTLKTYEGQYENGTAKYTYFENEKGERVREGTFVYIEKSINSKVTKDINGQVTGTIQFGELKQATLQYKNGQANGQAKKQTYLYNSTNYLDLNKITTTNSKITEECIYHYNDGKFDGSYQYQYYDNGDKTKIKYKINATIKDNHLVGKYEKLDNLLGQNLHVTGSFDNEGYFDGEWKVDNFNPPSTFIKGFNLNSNVLINEYRKYEHGKLIRFKFNESGTGKLIAEWPDKQTELDKTTIPSNIKIDSLKMSFNIVANNFWHDKSNFIKGDGKAFNYKDVTAFETRDFLNSVGVFNKEFMGISGFVKAYQYNYKPTEEERSIYASKHCYEFVNNFWMQEFKFFKDITWKVPYTIGNNVFYKDREMYRIQDTIYQSLNDVLLNKFSESQKKEYYVDEICYKFTVDTIAYTLKRALLFSKAINHVKSLDKFYRDTFQIISNELRKGNEYIDSIQRSVNGMPYYDMNDLEVKKYAKQEEKDYMLKRQSMIDSLYSEIINYKKELLNLYKSNDAKIIYSSTKKATEDLKLIDKKYYQKSIDLIHTLKLSEIKNELRGPTYDAEKEAIEKMQKKRKERRPPLPKKGVDY